MQIPAFGASFRPVFKNESGFPLNYEDKRKVLSQMVDDAKKEGKTATWYEESPYGSQRWMYLEDDAGAAQALESGKGVYVPLEATPGAPLPKSTDGQFIAGDMEGQDASHYLKTVHDAFFRHVDTQPLDTPQVETAHGTMPDLSEVLNACERAQKTVTPLERAMAEKAQRLEVAVLPFEDEFKPIPYRREDS